MILSRLINVVDSHTVGEPTRVITGGVPHVPGKTMAEKKLYLERELDSLRRVLMREPRGHKDMFGALLTEPTVPEADLGVVFMENGGYLNMCGHASIGSVTVALETGILRREEPVTSVTLDTPSGLVKARAEVKGGRVTSVAIVNVPSFSFMRDLEFNVPGLGIVKVDIAFGGNFFALVPAEALDIKVLPEHSAELIDKGMRIKDTVNDSLKVIHPEKPHIDSVDLVEIYERKSRLHGTNAVIFGNRSLDRSPCGTGTSAKLAVLHARGEIAPGEEYVHESILGTVMKGKVLEETTVSGIPAIVPEIRARAHITGFNHIVIDPEDPLKEGFLLD